MKKTKKIRQSAGDRTVGILCRLLALMIIAIMVYPFLYIIAVSLSQNDYVVMGMVKLFPKGFNLNAYKAAFSDPLIGRGYINTILYALTGTLLTLAITMLTAYPLAVKDFRGKKIFIIFMTITMYFSGGLIPYYILIQNLGLKNTIWAIILPGVSVWYIIICKTFFQNNIPSGLRESAWIDGANDLVILTRIYLPLSKPILATISLWSIVGHWNGWFNALLFIEDQNKYPLQMIVRKVLIAYEPTKKMRTVIASFKSTGVSEQTVRCALIIITILPIIAIYPFLQKYFVKGIMVGALKG